MNRFFLPLLLLLAPLTAVAEQNLLFILDASGSMWGRVQGEPKITIARDVMADLVGELPADSHAGLIAYGHNRKGDCDDIETLVPLGPLQREELIERIQALNPKGKTPITASVRRAVEHLRTLESAASVVLVSDGLESCGGDPCAAVREAREAGVDFRLHVVGFDLGEQDSEQLQCMARAADGRYFSAGNADELSEALKQAVAVSPALQLTVTANGEPAAAQVFIEPAGGGDEVARASVGDREESNPRRIELPAGDYDVLIRARGIAGQPEKHITGITIPEEGAVERQVDFSSGKLEVRVTANGEPVKARTYIHPADSDEEAARRRTDKDGAVDYNIPPGEYRILVRPDGIDAPDREIEGVEVIAGETTRKTVDYSAGRLELTVTVDGEPLKARTYVYHADSGEEASRGRADKEGLVDYEIPPGEYRILVRPDGIDAPDREIEGVEVTAGETTRKAVDYSAGRLELTVTVDGEPLKARTYVYHADSGEEASRGRVDRDGLVDYDIPPGEYRILVRPDGIDAPKQTVEGVVVNSGETSRQTVEYSAGTLAVQVTTNGEPLKARTYVYHKDSGEEASRGRTDNNGDASYKIPPGEYRIKIRPDGIDAPDQVIDGVVVTAGEVAEHSLDIPSGSIALTVENGGEPLKARTYLRDPELDKEVSRSRTDNQGQASYRVPVGNYTLRIRPDSIDAPDRVLETVSVASGQTTDVRVDFAKEQ